MAKSEAEKQRLTGPPMTGEKRSFARSVGVILAAGVAAAAAFVAACVGGTLFGMIFLGEQPFVFGQFPVDAFVFIGFPLGTIVFTFVGYRLTRFFSPADDWTTSHKIVVAVFWFMPFPIYILFGVISDMF